MPAGSQPAGTGARYQFERHGYYCYAAIRDSHLGCLVFNRTVSLRDTWVAVEKSAKALH